MKFEHSHHLKADAILKAFSYQHHLLKADMVTMEIELLCALRGHIDVPTAFTFLCRYVRAGFFNKCMVQIACYIAEKCLIVYELLAYLPSLIAAGCVYIAQQTYVKNGTDTHLNNSPWSPTLVHYSGYTFDDIKPCVDAIRHYCFDDSKLFDLSDSYSLSSISTVSPNLSSDDSFNTSGTIAKSGFNVVSPTQPCNSYAAFAVVNRKHSSIQNGCVAELKY